jgi:hypothetical protein
MFSSRTYLSYAHQPLRRVFTFSPERKPSPATSMSVVISQTRLTLQGLLTFFFANVINTTCEEFVILFAESKILKIFLGHQASVRTRVSTIQAIQQQLYLSILH